MQGYITFKMIRTNLIFFLRELNLVYYNDDGYVEGTGS
jgi:hypothetical protein